MKTTAYINGKVYTMREEGDVVSAFVCRDGKFLYCGSDEQAKAMADEVVDLEGAPVLPGFIDTHMHLYYYAENLSKLMVDHVKSMQELKDFINKYSKTVPAGEWIYGFGFDNEFFTDTHEMPTRWDLDEACSDHPVLLARSCMHFFSANSMALEMAGIDKNFVPEVAGTVRYRGDGEPTGVVSDAAGARIVALVPDKLANLEAKKDALEQAIRNLNALGMTGIHAIEGKHLNLMEFADAYQSLAADGRLTARIYLGLNDLPNCRFTTGLGDEMVKYGFYKLYIDGNLGGRTSALLEAYSDDPSAFGSTNYTQEELTERVRAAYQRNIQVGIHVIGDRAADMFVKAIETVYAEDPKPDARFRIIHLSLVNEDLIERIKKLPVVVDIQPMFIHTDLPFLEDRLGLERCKYSNAWGRLHEEGILMTGGSDGPGAPYDPLEGIWDAVCRTNLDGEPAGGWHPEHKLSVYDSVCLYTKNAAYASFEENIKGTIESGKLADFVVLDEDVFTIDPMKIKDVNVKKTYLGGKCVYER